MRTKLLKMFLFAAIILITFQTGIELSYATETDKTSTYNGIEYPDAYYKQGVSPAFSINKDQESINPADGSLGIYSTDLLLKGKNGLDLKIARYYNSSNSNLKETCVYSTSVQTNKYGYVAKGKKRVITYTLASDGSIMSSRTQYDIDYYDDQVFSSGTDSRLTNIVDQYNEHYYDYYYYESNELNYVEYYNFGIVGDVSYTVPVYQYNTIVSPSTCNDKYFDLGAGWAFDFPFVEKRGNKEFLHYGSSGVWQINLTTDTTDSNLKGYVLKDVILNKDSSVSYPDNPSDPGYATKLTSKYSIKEKDGKTVYIAEDGLILGVNDRYGNKIRFRHSTHSVDYFDFDPKLGVIRSDNYPLISQIDDSLNRAVVFSYSSDKITITVTNALDSTDKKTITYNKKLVKNASNALDDIPSTQKSTPRFDSEYLLDSVTENVNTSEDRTISYQYNVKYAKESLLTKNKNHYNNKSTKFVGTYNYFACLSQLTYPTGGKTVYEYNPGIKYSIVDNSVNGDDSPSTATPTDPTPDGVIKNCGADGSMYFYRVIKRYDDDSKGKVYNTKTYTYNKSQDGNNYDGYPAYSDVYDLPDTNSVAKVFKFSTVVTYDTSISTRKETYTFNNKLLCEDYLDEASDHKHRTLNSYDKSKKLLIQTTNRSADVATGRYIASTKDYSYNIFGDMIGFWDTQTARVNVNDDYLTTQTGNAKAGTVNTIELASVDNGTKCFVGQQITLTEGPGAGDVKTIKDYSSTTKIATVDSNFSSTPTTLTKYSVCDVVYKTTYSYDSNYHFVIGKTYKIDANTTIREAYQTTANQTTDNGRSIEYARVYEKKGTGTEILKKKPSIVMISLEILQKR